MFLHSVRQTIVTVYDALEVTVLLKALYKLTIYITITYIILHYEEIWETERHYVHTDVAGGSNQSAWGSAESGDIWMILQQKLT